MDWIVVTGSLLREMSVNRLRRFLSILGVIIGIGAVIASLAVVEGGRQQLYRHLEKLGVNIVFLEDRTGPPGLMDPFDGPNPAHPIGDPAQSGQELDTEKKKAASHQRMASGDRLEIRPSGALSRKDIAFFRRRFPQAASIEPQYLKWDNVARAGSRPADALVEGGTPRGAAIRNLHIAEGRYLCDRDVDNADRVCVLGAAIAEALFRPDSALGGYVSTMGARWRVVGVLEPKGSLMRFDYDELVIVPLTSLQERTGSKIINGLLIRGRDTEAALKIHSELLDEVLARLPERRPEDFQLFSQDELVEQNEATLRTFRILTVAIAAFSLLVSGIGIMNIMLVSVRERTREIGIWKAVGATDRDVLLYFLAESVMTCVIGGILGIILGIFLGARATDLIATTVAETPGWTPVFRPAFILLAFGTALFIGLCSGIFPAYVAARLEPVEALRSE